MLLPATLKFKPWFSDGHVKLLSLLLAGRCALAPRISEHLHSEWLAGKVHHWCPHYLPQ